MLWHVSFSKTNFLPSFLPSPSLSFLMSLSRQTSPQFTKEWQIHKSRGNTNWRPLRQAVGPSCRMDWLLPPLGNSAAQGHCITGSPDQRDLAGTQRCSCALHRLFRGCSKSAACMSPGEIRKYVEIELLNILHIKKHYFVHVNFKLLIWHYISCLLSEVEQLLPLTAVPHRPPHPLALWNGLCSAPTWEHRVPDPHCMCGIATVAFPQCQADYQGWELLLMKVARDHTARVTPTCIDGKQRSGTSQKLTAVAL